MLVVLERGGGSSHQRGRVEAFLWHNSRGAGNFPPSEPKSETAPDLDNKVNVLKD